ncbi:MAG: ABC transporter substrate-binding protein [Firmicutes bacterium]|nr:ABC transporter substrate-binding protein [Bacillota bacterium]
MGRVFNTKWLALAGVAIALLLVVGLLNWSNLFAPKGRDKATTYTLQILGNANEDGTIDEHDIEYLREIIAGKRPKTSLADANNDGVIDEKDIKQVKKLIGEEAEELFVLDTAGRIVKIKLPVKKVVAFSTSAPAGALRILGKGDMIIAINGMITGDPFYPEHQGKPAVGWPEPNYEAIVNLNPDLVIASANPAYAFEVVEKMKPFGIAVVQLDLGGKPEKYLEELRTLSWIMGGKERAEEFIKWSRSYVDFVRQRLSQLKPEERKSVYYEFIGDYQVMGRADGIIQGAGGVNVFAELFEGDYLEHRNFTVDAEEVIRKNPDVIIKDPHIGFKWSGYARGVLKHMEELKKELMARPGWSELKAVKNGNVYIISREVGNERTLSIVLLSKLLYPDLFQDVDESAVLKEFLERFHGRKYEDYAVYIYPLSKK